MSRGVYNLANFTELLSRGMRNTAAYDNIPRIVRRNRVRIVILHLAFRSCKTNEPIVSEHSQIHPLGTPGITVLSEKVHHSSLNPSF
jgi:hypothetical protein